MSISAPILRADRAMLKWWIQWITPLRSFWPVVAVGVHVSIGTLIWQHLLSATSGAEGSFGEAFYFSVVTFLTIGYGDMAPASDTGKVYFILYCIASLIVQLTIVSELLSTAISFRPTDPEDVQGGAQRATVKTYFQVQPRIRKAVEGFALLFALIAAGAVMLHVTDGSEGRQLTWLDCWYWSITTISTVGYGDIVPSQHKVAFACFFLVTVVLFAYLLGESVALVSEIKRYRRMDEFFSKGLTPEILDAMDIFRDGQVAKVEFLMFILDRLELVGQDEMHRILEMFDEADASKDGVLDLQDTRSRMTGAVGEGTHGELEVDAGSMDPMHGAEVQPMLRKKGRNSSPPPGA